EERVERLVKAVRKGTPLMSAVQDYLGTETLVGIVRMLPKIRRKLPEAAAALGLMLKDMAAKAIEEATTAGCVLVRVEQSGRDLVGHFECPDAEEGQPLATATLLENLTAEDTGKDALDPALVSSICASSQGAARAAHAYVRDHVRFEDEEVETFAAPSATLRRGFGDCD